MQINCNSRDQLYGAVQDRRGRGHKIVPSWRRRARPIQGFKALGGRRERSSRAVHGSPW
jgi:hypothetical protein